MSIRKIYTGILLASLFTPFAFSEKNPQSSSEPSMSGTPLIGAPKIQFEEPVHNFGVVVQGSQIKHRFIFKNIGTADLVIWSAKGSCGCTAAAVSTGPFRPGEQGFIDVTNDSRGKFGHVYKDVHVNSNDPAS